MRVGTTLVGRAALAAAMFLVAACGTDDGDDTAADTTVAGSDGGASADGEPIVLGALVELSGPGAALGEPESNALKLYFETLNANGGIDGRPVELIVKDTESKPERAVELSRELIGEGVIAIVGPSLAAECNAVRPVAVEAEVVHYCLSGAPFTYDDPYFFAAFEDPSLALGGLPAAWMEEEGIEKVACIGTSDNSGDAYLNSFTAAVEDSGIEVLSEKFAPGDTSVETQLTNVQAADVDAIYSCASGANLVPVVQGVVALGLDLPIFAGSGSASGSVAEIIKDTLPDTGVYTIGSWVVVPMDEIPFDVPNRDAIIEFREAFEDEFGVAPDSNAAGATDIAGILVQALANATDGPSLADALVGVTHSGLLAEYSLTETDHRGARSPGVIAKFNAEGGFSFVTQVSAE